MLYQMYQTLLSCFQTYWVASNGRVEGLRTPHVRTLVQTCVADTEEASQVQRTDEGAEDQTVAHEGEGVRGEEDVAASDHEDQTSEEEGRTELKNMRLMLKMSRTCT